MLSVLHQTTMIFVEMTIISYSLSWWSDSDNSETIEKRLLEERKESTHHLCILNIERDLPVGSTGNNLHLGLCEGWKAQASEWGC